MSMPAAHEATGVKPLLHYLPYSPTNKHDYGQISRFFCVLVITMLSACASHYPNQPTEIVNLPKTWQSHGGDSSTKLFWSKVIQSEPLQNVLEQAIENNQELAQKALDVAIAHSAVFQSTMRYVPELDATYSARRSANETSTDTTAIANQFSLTTNISYELNLWGQLSDERKSALFTYMAVRFDYEQTLRSLVSEVTDTWASATEANQLVKMRIARLESLNKNLSIIESGYRSGLNSALEVYLARNEVESENSQLIQTRQTLSDANRSLHLLLGDYPKNIMRAPSHFPQAELLLPPELPSELLMRRADLQAAWLRVLAQNANVAMAHKARFPSLRLTASAGYDSNEASSLLDGPIEWSLGGTLIQPILNAGRLKAAETNARFALEQSELTYNAAVYNAFREVESGLEKQGTLEQQYRAILSSRDNALQAEKLSFDQYMKGIVSYTTVLDAQRRALDAEIQRISLQKQIFINKVTLHEALAGELDLGIATTFKGH